MLRVLKTNPVRWQICRGLQVMPWMSVDPDTVSKSKPHTVKNLLNGRWETTQTTSEVVDPLNGDVFMHVSDTKKDELQPFIDSLISTPKSGLHNPFKNPERYLKYGHVTAQAASMLAQDDVADFFARCIQRVVPKSYAQALGEVKVTQAFLENFGGDQVRFLARSFGIPGDYTGQMSNGYRWPYGPVALITPFNFPVEIPILQLMGALYMGNKPVLKVDPKVSMPCEQFLRMLIACGMPPEDVLFMNCDGPVMNEFLLQAKPRNTLFTGSSRVGEKLAKELSGKIKLEDAGFDWKILGPDVGDEDYVAWKCDQDAYAATGQKCSAQSILFMHENWTKAGLPAKLKELAESRNLEDLTVGPVLSWTTEAILDHAEKLLKIPGAKLLFGGKELENHTIPKCYGAVEPTAIFVPLEQLLSDKYFSLASTEVFGPFQVVTEYDDSKVDHVLQYLEKLSHHLTAAVVSNDPVFTSRIAGSTVNGTTYIGRCARTTGAPQNHWFGPAGDPRGAGIGTPEAIQMVWSCHREIISDFGPVAVDWQTPPPS